MRTTTDLGRSLPIRRGLGVGSYPSPPCYQALLDAAPAALEEG